MASPIRIISFNVNGIRARLHQLEQVLKQHEPDVLGLQEIKVSDEEFPIDAVTKICLLYTSPSPRDLSTSRMPSSA